MLDCNTIIQIKNADFFEDILTLRSSATSSTNTNPKQPVETCSEPMCDDLRRSKRKRVEKSFGDNIYTYLVEDDPLSFFETISSLDANLWE